MREDDSVGPDFVARECRLTSVRPGIPEPDGVVIGRRQESLAVVQEGDGVNQICMTFESRLMNARLDIPEPDGAVVGRRREPLAVV